MVRVPSPPQSLSKAVVCVSTPRMYQRSWYFLVYYISIIFFSPSLGITVEDLYENFERPKIKVGAEWVTKGQNTTQVNVYVVLSI